MKKMFLASLAALMLITGCTKPNTDTEDTGEIEIEEETEIEIEESETSGGL